MVRTRSGEILGPFSQKQLVEELSRNTFSTQDEIAPSLGDWISAHTLHEREADEFTQTMTKSRAVTDSVSVTGSTASDYMAARTGSITASDNLAVKVPPMPEAVKKLSEFETESEAPSKFSLPVSKMAILRPVMFLLIGGGVTYFVLSKRYQPTTAPEPVAAPTFNQPVESPFLKEVNYLIKIGKRTQALEKLTEFHQKPHAENDIAYLIPYSALLITENESTARARKLLQQVLASPVDDSLKAQAHLWLGYIMLAHAEGDAGASHFQETLEIDPKNAAARFNLGRAYLRQNKNRQALEYFQFAELEAPDMWLIHIYKGRARAALSNMQEARFAFMTAVQTAEDRWLPYVYFSLFLMGIREPLAAQNTLHKMLSRDPEYELNAPPPLGFYQERIDYNEYESAFMQVMKGGSPLAREIGRLYINYLKNGPKSVEGKRLLRMAEGENTDLTAKVIALKIQLDNAAPALQLNQALSQLPTNLSEFGYYAYVLRGQARLRLGQIKEAQADLKRAILLEPKSAVGRLAYANFLKRMNQPAQAQIEINNLLTFHPNYIPALVSSEEF